MCPFVGLVGGGIAEVECGGDMGGGCGFATLTEGVICDGRGVGSGGGCGFGDSDRAETEGK